MIDFSSSCLDHWMEEVDQSLGVCVFQVLAVGICKEPGDGLDEFGRHFQLLLWVDFEFEPAHTFEQVFDFRFSLFRWGCSIS
jgi:hypothetical protein